MAGEKYKFGVGICTFNRPNFLKLCLESLPKGDYQVFVLNDGGKDVSEVISPFKRDNFNYINRETNLGVAKTKNELLELLLDQGLVHIFLIEDDIILKDQNVFEKYIEASLISGIMHFNYGPGSPFNRKQDIQFDLHNRHLLKQNSPPNPKLVIEYEKGIKVALYEHTVAMFSYFRDIVIKDCGLFPTCYKNCWEHVHHTNNIIQKGYHPYFWWFSDLFESDLLLEEAPGAIDNSAIATKKEDWMKNVMDGREIYKNHFGYYPNNPPVFSQGQVIEQLKQIKNKYASKHRGDKCGNVIDRDYNAALNLKKCGEEFLRQNTVSSTGINACGDITSWSGAIQKKVVPKKQEDNKESTIYYLKV